MQPDQPDLAPPEGWRRGPRLWRSARRGGPVPADLPLDTGTARGVLLPMRPQPVWHAVLFLALAAGFLVLCGCAVVAAGRGHPQAWAALPIFAVPGVLFGFGTYAAIRSRGRIAPGVGLTPTHLVLTNYARPVPMRWDQVRRIGSPSIRWGTGPIPDPVTNLVAIVVTDETLLAYLPSAARRISLRALRRTGEVTIATIPEASWAMDPTVAYHALRCYLDRPDLRGELAGEAAIRRIGRRALADQGEGPGPG